MTRLYEHSDSIQPSILQHIHKTCYTSTWKESDISSYRLIDEILMLDPEFDLGSFLVRLRSQADRKSYLLSSSSMNLYNILRQSRSWDIDPRDANELQISVNDMDLTNELETLYGNLYMSYNDIASCCGCCGFLTTQRNAYDIIAELKEIDKLYGYVESPNATYKHIE